MVRWLLLALGASLLLLGCGQDERPPTWSYIHEAIIAPNCTTSSCHSSISAAFGLDLHDRGGAYVALTGSVCGSDEGTDDGAHNLVWPGDPVRSKLMHLLWGDEVDVMPPDVPLPDPDIDLIEQWIVNGAQCD